MTSRYQELYRIEKNLYLEGSPVLIEAGALQKDIVDDRVLAQVKLRNISNKKIIACKVCIWAYEPSGAELEGIASFSYLDIAVKQGQDFGTKTPIYLPDNATRRFDVAVIEVVSDDGIVWSEEPAEWTALSAQKKVKHVLNDFELEKQYGLEAGANSSYYPELTRGLFLCTCGAVNIGGENTRCYKCGRKYDDLIKILDVENLTYKYDERVKKEEENRRIEREREEKRKAEAAKLAAERKAEEERLAEKIQEQKQLDAKRRKKIILSIIVAILFISVVLASAITYKRIQKSQDQELVSTIESSIYNRIYKNFDLDESEKIRIQKEELNAFNESHIIIIADRELKNKYYELIDLLDEQEKIMDRYGEAYDNNDIELEILSRDMYCNWSKTSDIYWSIVEECDMCSDNPILRLRLSQNTKYFNAQKIAWTDVVSIDQSTRGQILSGGSLELKNNTDYKVTFMIFILDDTGKDFAGGDVVQVLPGKTGIAYKPELWSQNIGDTILITPSIEDFREEIK